MCILSLPALIIRHSSRFGYFSSGFHSEDCIKARVTLFPACIFHWIAVTWAANQVIALISFFSFAIISFPFITFAFISFIGFAFAIITFAFISFVGFAFITFA